MTDDNFVLSDHIDEADDGMNSYIDVYAVKEFIRRLKDEIDKPLRKMKIDEIWEIIDKLAGDDLIDYKEDKNGI